MYSKGSLQILQDLPLSSLFPLPVLPNYLEDIGHHVGGRLPLGTELHSKGLPFLIQDADPRGVHQQGYHSQAFLLQRIEHHHKPAKGLASTVPGSTSSRTRSGLLPDPAFPGCQHSRPPLLPPGCGIQFDHHFLWQGVLVETGLILEGRRRLSVSQRGPYPFANIPPGIKGTGRWELTAPRKGVAMS